MKIGRLFHGPARAWAARRDFASTADVLKACWVSLWTFVRPPAGLRRAEVGVRAVGAPRPTLLRLGTTDMQVFHEIFRRDEYEPVKSFVRDAKFVIDLGSNVGISCHFWKQLWPGCEVIAVEPDLGNFMTLQRNLEGLPGPKVLAVRACVGGSRRKVRMVTSDGEWALRMSDRAAGGPALDEVDVITMADLLKNVPPNQPIDFLKCDIEGAEEELLASAADWLPRVRHLVIELHGDYTPVRLLADLERNGLHAIPFPGCGHGQHKVEFLVCTAKTPALA